jgi:hypothetical protein
VKWRHPGVRRAAAALAALGLLSGLVVTPVGVSAQDSVIKKAADGKIKPAVVNTGSVTRKLPGFSGGTLTSARFIADQGFREEEADAASGTDIQQLKISQGTLGCRARNTDGNVRVNQDCTFRRQAEELIKINPTDPSNIIAGQNDSRIGYNHCGFDYSFDGGKHWGDGIPPFYQRENHPERDGPTASNPNKNTIVGGKGTNHTYDAGSDPAIAFDSAGRAFYSCVLFDVHTDASGLLVTQSPEGAGGSFYDNVSATGRAFVVVEDNSPLVAHDKEFIAADAFPHSPNKDNVYITWTVFFFDKDGNFLSSPIWGSMSTDHAVTWSTPEEISGTSKLCFLGDAFDPNRPPNACDLDQGSDPQPLPDGSLAVIFNNGNTAPNNPNAQQLAVLCHPRGSSPAGTAHLNCGSATRVGDDVIVGEPQCNVGRGPEECVPGPFIRTNDFPRIALDKSNNDLYAVWQDYRNGEYDIQLSRSTDKGVTWKEAKSSVNSTRGFDLYMPAVDVGSDHKVAVSFYRSDRVPNENTLPHHEVGCIPTNPPTPGDCFLEGDPGVRADSNKSSYWLSGGQHANTPFALERISPFFPPPDGNQLGFNGDYSGLAVSGSTAHPIWSDTRNSAIMTSPKQGVVHDEDVFTDTRAIPSGSGGDDNDDNHQND